MIDLGDSWAIVNNHAHHVGQTLGEVLFVVATQGEANSRTSSSAT